MEGNNNALTELTMLFAVLVRRGVPQATLIQELDAVGFGQKRIAELAGTTAATVNSTLYKRKNKKSGKKQHA